MQRKYRIDYRIGEHKLTLYKKSLCLLFVKIWFKHTHHSKNKNLKIVLLKIERTK